MYDGVSAPSRPNFYTPKGLDQKAPLLLGLRLASATTVQGARAKLACGSNSSSLISP